VAATNVAVLWAVGDGADGRAPGKAVAARIAGSHIYRLLYLGDVYGDGGAASDGTGRRLPRPLRLALRQARRAYGSEAGQPRVVPGR